MRNYLLSDVDAGKIPDGTHDGWHWFETLQRAIHRTGAAVSRHVGQSWADYMDELEDQQLLQRQQLRRRVLRTLAFTAVGVLVFVTLNF